MDIDHTNLRRLDLNLLVAFDALLSERSVMRAAIRVGLGQSAMSHNLARLRRLFDDELLTRSADGMQPMPLALALADQVRMALQAVQSAVSESGKFNPATADRVFRIGLADSIEVAIMPALVERLQSLAPGVSLRLRPANRTDVIEELDTCQLDLGLAFSSRAMSTIFGGSSKPIISFASSVRSSWACPHRSRSKITCAFRIF